MADFTLQVNDSVSKKHRTSVLYDFSSVKKAKFYEFQASSGTSGDYTFKNHVYSVQINPSQLSAYMGIRRVDAKPAMAPGVKEKRVVDASSRDYSLNIELRYDIFDEYMVRTADGLLQGVGHDFDLTSEEATSLGALINGYNDPTIAYLFKWGPIEYFGYIENLEFNYTAFSRWGHPLKGIGSLRLCQAGMTLGPSGRTIPWEKTDGAPEEKISRAAIESREAIEDLEVRAGIGVTQALR